MPDRDNEKFDEIRATLPARGYVEGLISEILQSSKTIPELESDITKKIRNILEQKWGISEALSGSVAVKFSELEYVPGTPQMYRLTITCRELAGYGTKESKVTDIPSTHLMFNTLHQVLVDILKSRKDWMDLHSISLGPWNPGELSITLYGDSQRNLAKVISPALTRDTPSVDGPAR